MTPAGFPHSEISGSKPVSGSPELIAADHVFHRLLVPRHSPCALSSLTIIKQSVIIKIRGNKAYDHVKKFSDLNLIKRKKMGHTNELSLSEDFYDYFSIADKGNDISTPFINTQLDKEIEEAEREVEAEEQEILANASHLEEADEIIQNAEDN